MFRSVVAVHFVNLTDEPKKLLDWLDLTANDIALITLMKSEDDYFYF